MNVQLIDFERFEDRRGALVAIEQLKNCPFEIKRVYYMFNTDLKARRGYHSHKNLQQILICVHGSCTIHLEDRESSMEVVLDNPSKGLYIGQNIWREMYDFTEDAVLMAIASELYDENDYIRDYQKFMDEE